MSSKTVTDGAKVDWDEFDPVRYVHDNYSFVSDEDRVILTEMTRFIRRFDANSLRVAEVGMGPNLYPTMTYICKAKSVTGLEFSSSNIAYLLTQLREIDSNWEEFWQVVKGLNECPDGETLVDLLRSKFRIVKGSVYENTLQESSFDVVSSHFCVESITDTWEGFLEGCRSLCSLLTVDGSLIASFLKGSSGYSIAEKKYPAFPLTKPKLLKALQTAGFGGIEVKEIDNSGQLANDEEWSGMFFVTARKTTEKREDKK